MWVPLRPVPPTKISSAGAGSLSRHRRAPRTSGAEARRNGSRHARSDRAPPRTPRRSRPAPPGRALAPALPVSGAGAHLLAEEGPHRRLVVDPQEGAQALVRRVAVAPDELVQADDMQARTDRPVRAPRPRRAAGVPPTSRCPRLRRWGDGPSGAWRPSTSPSRARRAPSARSAPPGRSGPGHRAAAIVKQLISTRVGLPSSSASGPSRAKKSAREAATGSSSAVASKSLIAASRRSRVVILWRPRTLASPPRRAATLRRRTVPRPPTRTRCHQKRRSLSTNSFGVVRPSTRSARPFGLQWKRHSIGTEANRECSPSRLATMWVPLRPVPPTNTSSAGSRAALIPWPRGGGARRCAAGGGRS